MNRRSFLSAFTVAAAAAVVDPERLLWTPTKKIFIPPPVSTIATGAAMTSPFFQIGDLITFAGHYAWNPKTGKRTEFLQYFKVVSVAESGMPSFTPLPFGKNPS